MTIKSTIRTVAATAALAAGAGITLLAAPGIATAATPTGGCSNPTGGTLAVECNTANFGTGVVGQASTAPVTFTNNVNQAVRVFDWGPDYGQSPGENFTLEDGGCPGATVNTSVSPYPFVTLQPGQSCTTNMTVVPQQAAAGMASDPQPLSFQTLISVSGVDGTNYFTEVNNVMTLKTSGTPTPAPTQTAGATCSTVFPAGTVVGMADTADNLGYWIADSNGQVASCGDAPALGNAPVGGIAAIAATPDAKGYYLVSSTGSVFAFGDAKYQGGVNFALAKPVVAMTVDPSTGGYWLLGGDGGVFSYNAPFYGSTGNIVLNKPAVGMESTADGHGYYFVASDGGVFAYGDAPFHGSVPGVLPRGVSLNKPVVGMALDPATGGYWMDASDGGIFSFDAPFYGSTGNIVLNQPCVGMAASPNGGGYRFVAADGGIFDFGNSGFYGSAA